MNIKGLIKQILFTAKFYRLGSLSNKFHILPFHMVVDRPNNFFPEMSTHLFEKQVTHLVKNYHIISMDEIIKRINERESLRGCVAITFDDGFKDNYGNAYPILRRYSIPATIFLTTGHIESGTAPWFIKLRYMFMKTDKIKLELSLNKQILLPMQTRQEKFAASEKVMAYFKECSDDKRRQFIERLGMELEVSNFEELDNLMLNWDEIREMAENGISFGAHTVNHTILTRIPLDMAEREIFQSKKTIEERVGKPVTGFAYPFGKEAQYNYNIVTILHKLQFKYAVTTRMSANTYRSDLFTLNRVGPWELTLIN